MRKLILWAGLAMLAVVARSDTAAASEPLRIANLQVEGGASNWHAKNLFRLDWDQIPGPPVEAGAVIYRLFDTAGDPLGPEVRNSEETQVVEGLRVPPHPGIYTAEVWLEDAAGHSGPHASVALRFDDQVPAPPDPQAPPSWLAAGSRAALRIGHPASPFPISGIRGYAISLGREGASSPCTTPGWCSAAETDLTEGVDDDEFPLGNLPEGTTFASVAAVSGSGVPSPIRTVAFRVDATPPLLSLVGVPGGWARGPVKLTALATDPLSGMASDGPSGPFTAIAIDGGGAAQKPGDAISTWVTGTGVHTLVFFGRDAAGNVNDGELDAPLPATATIRIDEANPRVTFAAAQDPGEPERIEATVTDSLSGANADRGTIAVRGADSGLGFKELPTQVTGNRLIAHWDSDSFPPGRYEFLATGFDAAGNATSSGKRDWGGRMILANPLKTPVWVQAGFGRKRTAKGMVRYGRGILFRGRLYAYGGTPVDGQKVAVTETFAAGSRPAGRVTSTVTRADGTFSVRLPPGPSREVVASYAGSRLLTRASAQSNHLTVLTSVHLHASAASARIGGAPILFSGKVAHFGVGPSKKGLPVELQFRYPGVGWREFRSVTAGSSGRFRYAYRFSDDDSRGVRFQFRAFVPSANGWPYEPAASRPVIVTGR